MVDKVNEQTLDVGPVLILISHDHDLPVSQTLHVIQGLILLLVSEPHDLDEVGDLLVLHDLLVGGLPHIEKLTLERIHAVIISANHPEPRHGQGLGEVPLGEDERSARRVLSPGLVGVLQLGDAPQFVRLLARLFGFELGVRRLNDAGFLKLVWESDKVHFDPNSLGTSFMVSRPDS